MAGKYPRYVSERKGGLFYQRDYPISMHIYKKQYSRTLKLKANNYTDSELQQAITTATQAYELSLKMMQNSSLENYTEAELEKAAAEYIRKLGYKAGELADDESGLDDQLIEVDDIIDAGRTRQLTVEEEVAVRAYRAISQAEAKKSMMLSQVWPEYVAKKRLDLTTREGINKQRKWDRIFACIGEQKLTSPRTLDAIHVGIDKYWTERREAGVKVQTVRRSYAEVVAALNYTSTRHRLNWVIKPDSEGGETDEETQKAVLDMNEQIALAKHCLADRDTPAVSACIIFMMQSGAMVSEITRLNIDEVLAELDAGIPQISIGKDNKTRVKTKERRRVAPIVLGVDYLRQHIGEAIELCNELDQSSVSRQISKKIRQVTGNKAYTAHCLRHTLMALSDIADANYKHMAAIGGWKGGKEVISPMMLQYGADSLSTAEGFIAVTNTSRKVLAKLLEAVEVDRGNVVSITANS